MKMPRMKPERLSNLPTETGTRVPRNGVAADSTLATATLREDSVAQPPTLTRTAVAIAVIRNRDMAPPTFLDANDSPNGGARLAQAEHEERGLTAVGGTPSSLELAGP